MAEWKKYTLQDLATIKYGKNQKDVVSQSGTIPIFGTGGLMGYATKPLYSEPSVLIGRKGTIEKVHYVTEPFWTVDTLFYTIINKELVTPYFFYCLMQLVDLKKLNEGTTIPSLRTETLNRLTFNVPPLSTQKKIAEVLSCLDAKIELNRRINENLKQQAQAIFKEWFVDNAKPEWKVGKLEDYVTIKRGGSPRPIQNYLTETGLRWLKISDVTSLNTPFIFNIAEHIKEEGLNKTVFLKAGSLVLSNSATPGIPKILAVDSCIHDGWLYFTDSKFSNEFLYLLFQHARPDFLSKGNGSIFINLKTDIVKAYQFPIPDDESLEKFQSIVGTLFGKMYQVTAENLKLAEIRDALLPKLMNGELEV